MTHNQTEGSSEDDEIFRTLNPEEEQEVREILQERWLHRFKVQNILSEEQQKQLKRILKRKWFFERPLYGFPVERSAKVVESFMQKTFHSVEPNIHDGLEKQDEVLNSLMVEDEEWYFSMLCGRKAVGDAQKEDCVNDAVLSESQENELNQLLEEEKEANGRYLEDHPEVEAIVGVFFSNLCYYRPPDVLEFTKALFGTCESCLRGNISSYLEHKKRAARVNPFDTIVRCRELTDWRKVKQRLATNERVREKQEELSRRLEAGHGDDLLKAHARVVQKKKREISVSLIDSVLDEIIAKQMAVEEQMKVDVVRQIIELVLDEIFREDDYDVLLEKSKEISKTIVNRVLSNVFQEVEQNGSVKRKKSEIVTNVIEIVVEQVIREVEDEEITKILEANKDKIILQIIEGVFNKIFGEPIKLEDRLTCTDLDLIIEAADKVMQDPTPCEL